MTQAPDPGPSVACLEETKFGDSEKGRVGPRKGALFRRRKGWRERVWCGPREPHEKSKGKGRSDWGVLSSEFSPVGCSRAGHGRAQWVREKEASAEAWQAGGG